MKYCKSLLLLLLTGISLLSFSQKLQDNIKSSTYTYIYKLDSTAVSEIYSTRNLLDSLKYFTNLCDSFRYDVTYDYTKLNMGHYLFLKGEGDNVRYWLYENPVFSLRSLGVNQEILVFVYDLKGELLKDARLKLIKNGKGITFREDCGCYPIPTSEKKNEGPPVDFMVYRGKDYTFGSFSYNSGETAPRKKKSRRHSDENSSVYGLPMLPGYMVLNQPKFKLLDTLKWKAFLTKPNGKGYNKAVKLFVTNDYNGQIIKQQTINPVYKGAYNGELVLGDTLTLDNQYSVKLFGKRGRLLKTESFRIENYDLKKSFFNASLNNTYYYAGESIDFTVSAFDANKLPLLDSKIQVKVNISAVSDWYDDSLFIPFSWSEKYWEFNCTTDPGGITRIHFPDSLLFNAKIQFNASVIITNAEGENKSFVLAFSYDPEKERFRMYHEKDSIKAEYLYNSQVVEKKVILKAFNGKELYQKEIQLPYSFKVEDFPINYQLFSNGKQRCYFDVNSQLAGSVGFEGRRTYDSIHILMINPLGLKVNYKIYYGEKLIDGGSGTSLDFKRKIPSDVSFYVIYSFRWRGEEYVKEQCFHLQEKTLNVDIQQAEVIYPGQKVAVDVHVTDYKNKDVKKANLTAYAVNTQIGDIKNPDMPYFGKSKRGILQSFQTFAMRADINNYKVLNPFYLKMKLFSESPYYQLLYDTSGLGLVYEDISDEKGEFSPYIIKGIENQTIYAVYLDKKPIYFANTSLRNPVSFVVEPGNYEMDIRTQDAMYTFKKVEIRKGKKLFLCLRTDSISRRDDVSYVKLQSPYLKEEMALMADHLLYFSTAFAKKTNYYFLVQGNKVLSGSVYNHYNQYSEIGNYFVAGPFDRGTVQLYFPGKDTMEFYFEPGYAYIFYDDSISVKDLSKQPSKIPTNISWIPQTPLINLGEKHYSLPKPIVTKPQEPIAVAVNKLRNHPALHDYSINLTERPLSHLIFKNNSGRDIKFIWLFNKEDEKSSRICYNPCYNSYNLKPGKYDVIILTQKDSLCFLKDFVVRPEGTNYRALKSSFFGKFDSLLIAAAEDRIVALNRPQPRVFDNPPLEIKEVKKLVKEVVKETKVSGYIMDQNGNPIDRVTVFMENAGVFVAGAITNQLGYFEIISGKYNAGQLKIFVNNKYYNYYQLFLSEKKNTELMVYLPNAEGQPYGWVLNTTDVTASYNNYTGNNYTYAASATEQLSPVMLESVAISSKSRMFHLASVNGVIDGLKLSNQTNALIPQENLNTVPSEKNKFSEFLDKIKADTNASRIRSKFRDYAYFIPNLITDKKGEAHYTVVFPDNQTLWKTIVPAMDYHKRSGLGLSEVKAYKPLSTSLSLPKFCIEGDSFKITGKVFNYTDQEIELTSVFKVNEENKFSLTRKVKTFNTDYLSLHFDTAGNYPVTYSFETTDKFIDGEKRTLAVLLNGTELVKGQNFTVENDTAFIISKENNIDKVTLTLTNNQLDLILDQVDKLKNYTYGCNEQNASKIKALLVEKTISPVIGKVFKEDKLIKELINKLERSQRKDGSWGWWLSSDVSDYWMSCYVIQALEMAVRAGFHTRAHIKGAEFLKSRYGGFTPTDKLFALEILCDFYNKFDYKKEVEAFETSHLSLQDQFRLLHLKQMIGIKYSTDSLLSAKTKDKDGIYWGEKVLNFKTNIIPTSALAYMVLKNDSLNYSETLKSVRHYFLTHTEMARNTIEQAVMLECIVNDIIKDKRVKEEINPQVFVNGQLYPVKSYPCSIKLNGDNSTTIEKKGAPLYFSVLKSGIDREPLVVDSLFRIKAWMEQKSKTSLVFTQSEQIQYQISLDVARNTEYVMIEIPIPASCNYLYKNTGKISYEVNREYFNDKVVIFCRDLPKGNHRITIPLQPLFEGKFTLLPVKVSLMYYPDHYGINKKQRIQVAE